jgi:hypothetical protein
VRGSHGGSEAAAGGAAARAEIVVVMPLGEWQCALCEGSGSLLKMEDAGPVCMSCVDLDHLEYLPRGDATLTRRARKASGLDAVVVRFSRARRRYERQGILAEPAVIERAEAECLADAELRERRRECEAARREAADEQLAELMAAKIRRLYPGCPAARAAEIAAHATVRSSGRVGRSAAGHELESRAIELAVTASIRHRDTDYDDLLMSGIDRGEARAAVGAEVRRLLNAWGRGAADDDVGA